MNTYKVIVEDDREAFEVVLPESIVERIKTISSLNDEDFEGKDNEIILKMLVKSLDMALYGHKHFKIEDCDTKTEENVTGRKKTK